MLTCNGAPLQFSEAKDCVHLHFLSAFGELGASELAFKLIKYDARTGKGIIRCARDRLDEAIFCMACLKDWKNSPARLKPLSTGGTIKRT
jgi:RNase P/RNase MRP subunit POP5